MKTLSDVGVKKQGRNLHIFVFEGERIGTFGQNIYPLDLQIGSMDMDYCFPSVSQLRFSSNLQRLKHLKSHTGSNLHGFSLTVSHLNIFKFYLTMHMKQTPNHNIILLLHFKTKYFQRTSNKTRILCHRYPQIARDNILFSLRIIAIKQRFATS